MLEAPEKLPQVLIVDDKEEIQAMLSLFFERMGGIKTICFDDAESALRELAVNENIRCVISDHNMSVMTGIEMLECLRADARLSNIPFILLSGRVTESESVREAAVKLEAKAVFAKPYSPAMILAEVQQIFNKR